MHFSYSSVKEILISNHFSRTIAFTTQMVYSWLRVDGSDWKTADHLSDRHFTVYYWSILALDI
jgi:hypothetical protein